MSRESSSVQYWMKEREELENKKQQLESIIRQLELLESGVSNFQVRQQVEKKILEHAPVNFEDLAEDTKKILTKEYGIITRLLQYCDSLLSALEGYQPLLENKDQLNVELKCIELKIVAASEHIRNAQDAATESDYRKFYKELLSTEHQIPRNLTLFQEPVADITQKDEHISASMLQLDPIPPLLSQQEESCGTLKLMILQMKDELSIDAEKIAAIIGRKNQLTDLLSHVVSGRQKEAELIIQCDPTLLFEKEHIEDSAGHRFNLTALQLALWAYDWNMWEMILMYLDRKVAASQLEELENKGTDYGVHYDFDTVITAWQTFVNVKRDTFITCSFWVEGGFMQAWYDIGKAQAKMPPHILQEYCLPDRIFNTAWTMGSGFQRCLKLKEGEVMRDIQEENLHSDQKLELGKNAAIYCDEKGQIKLSSGYVDVRTVPNRSSLPSLMFLKKQRQAQYEELRGRMIPASHALLRDDNSPSFKR